MDFLVYETNISYGHSVYKKISPVDFSVHKTNPNIQLTWDLSLTCRNKQEKHGQNQTNISYGLSVYEKISHVNFSVHKTNPNVQLTWDLSLTCRNKQEKHGQNHRDIST
jgi:NifB/MoaA-like Fe-S oxidoreductase